MQSLKEFVLVAFRYKPAVCLEEVVRQETIGARRGDRGQQFVRVDDDAPEKHLDRPEQAGERIDAKAAVLLDVLRKGFSVELLLDLQKGDRS